MPPTRPTTRRRGAGFRCQAVLMLVEENDLASKLRKCGRGRRFRCQSDLVGNCTRIETASASGADYPTKPRPIAGNATLRVNWTHVVALTHA